MSRRAIVVTCFLLLGTFSNSVFGQSDFFWSDKPLGEGAVNEPFVFDVTDGEGHTLYLYYTSNGPAMNEVVSGFEIAMETTNPGVIQIRSATILNAEVVWTDSLQPAGCRTDSNFPDEDGWVGVWCESSADTFSLYMLGYWDFGINQQHTGAGDFLDLGYDSDVDAFLCGRIDFAVVASGSTGFALTFDGVYDFDSQIPVEIGELVVVSTEAAFEPGDVNHDQAVNLLDVAPFVGILIDGEYLNEADMDQDGFVNLLDIAPFIDSLIN